MACLIGIFNLNLERHASICHSGGKHRGNPFSSEAGNVHIALESRSTFSIAFKAGSIIENTAPVCPEVGIYQFIVHVIAM